MSSFSPSHPVLLLLLLLIATLLAALIPQPAFATSFFFGPHEDAFQHTERQATCTNINLPPNLCRRCKMRPHNDDGTFNTTFKKDIYEIEDASCQKQIQKYVDMNPCDTIRKTNLARMDEQFHYERLAVFLYSTCELCCDCIPVGSVESDYEKYINSDPAKLINLNRGNCPAHLHYDNCKMWPEMRHVHAPWSSPITGRPIVCPKVDKWIKSPFGEKWPTTPNADGINSVVRRALNQIVKNTRCTDENVWKTCLRLERAQGRV